MSLQFTLSRTYSDTAVILRTQNLGETDRVIILLTPQFGVVHAVAKGVRKGNSRFGGRLEPFMYVDVSFVAAKNLHTISQVQTRRAFTAPLMSNFDAYLVALVLVELAEELTKFTEDEAPDLFQLLVGGLSALSRSVHHPLDIANSFVLRAMRDDGWDIGGSQCVQCGENNHLAWFSPELGLLCENCARALSNTYVRPLSKELVQYLSSAALGDWAAIDSQPHEEYAKYAVRLLSEFIQWHLEKPLKSLTMLEREI